MNKTLKILYGILLVLPSFFLCNTLDAKNLNQKEQALCYFGSPVTEKIQTKEDIEKKLDSIKTLYENNEITEQTYKTRKQNLEKQLEELKDNTNE